MREKAIPIKHESILLGFIPIEKNIQKAKNLTEITIRYKIFGFTVFKVLPVKTEISHSNQDFSIGSFGSGFNPSTTDLENS